MSIVLRVILLIAALLAVCYTIHRIRGAKVRLQDTLFWIASAVILLVMGIFPKVPATLASLIGIESPSNFVFLILVALLFEKVLTLSIQHSQMEEKMADISAELAIRHADMKKELEELEDRSESSL